MLFGLPRARDWLFQRNSSRKNLVDTTSLLARVSYELKTSLTGIVGYAEFLETKTFEPMMSFTAKIIRENSSNLARSSNAYFDLQYLQRGQLQLSNTQINLATLLKELVACHQAQALERGIRLQLFCSRSALSLFICSDAGRLRQVLDAMLFHTIHRSQKWDEINIHLSVDEAQKCLLLSVATTQVKLDERKLDLEQQFWNSDVYEFHIQEGPGVEMALAKELVRLLGYAAKYNVAQANQGIWQLQVPIKPLAATN